MNVAQNAMLIQDIEQCGESFRFFVEQAWHVLEPATPFVPGLHVDAICEHLQAVSQNQIRDLMINVPPGHAKSLLAAVFWPAWVWGPFGHPESRWLTASYKQDLAIRDSTKCRTLIGSEWYQRRWPIQFDSRQDAKERYQNLATGVRVITSVGVGTGERGDYILVDDPTSREQAESDIERKRANDWWSETMYNRVNNLATGHHIVIQQRLHQDDLTGSLLSKSHYVHLMLPQEYEPERACATQIGWKDPRTKAGELLWPARFGPQQVIDLKRELGSYAYSGQYQQRPAPATGGIFKRWWFGFWKPKYMDLKPVEIRLLDGQIRKSRLIDLPDEFDELCQSWDTAFRILNTADFVAGGVWGAKGPKRFLLEQRHGRMEFPDICEAIKLFGKRYPKIRATYIEDAANGSAIISTLRSTVSGIIAVKPEGGKVARAHAVSPAVEAGDVYLPHPAVAPWVNDFIEECAVFPNGTHDDQVDQMTQALLKMKNRTTMPTQPTRISQPPTGDRSWMA